MSYAAIYKVLPDLRPPADLTDADVDLEIRSLGAFLARHGCSHEPAAAFATIRLAELIGDQGGQPLEKILLNDVEISAALRGLVAADAAEQELRRAVISQNHLRLVETMDTQKAVHLGGPPSGTGVK